MRVKYIYFLQLLSVTYLLLVPFSTQAANKALLIGTTYYQSERNNLPGIELDIAEMDRVARKLGFEESNIKTLTGSDVTLENIEAQFSGFLTKDVLPGDTLLIYYSGHGVQVPDKNGDEADQEDEAISLYNLRGVYNPENEDEVIWDGVLVDDQLAELLGSLVSENVIVIVDACHSGTVTRSYTGITNGETKAYGDEKFSIKSLGPPRVATRGLSKTDSSIVDIDDSGVVTLSAAQDNQQALSSARGSLFTLALAESLETQRSNASPQSLIDSARSLLDDRLDDDLVYQPNLTGDNKLFAKPIVLTGAVDRGEVNQADLLRLSNEVTSLTMGEMKSRYVENELISVSMDIPVDGYINVIAVDTKDDMVILFPNGIDQDNHVEAGETELPGDRDFVWSAQAPFGNTMVVVLFSQSRINLFEMSLQRGQSGKANADYVLPSLASIKKYSQNSGLKAAAVRFLETCSEAGACE